MKNHENRRLTVSTTNCRCETHKGLATCNLANALIQFWDAKSGKPLPGASVVKDAVRPIAFLDDNKHIVGRSREDNRDLVICAIASGKKVAVLRGSAERRATDESLSLSRDSKWVMRGRGSTHFGAYEVPNLEK